MSRSRSGCLTCRSRKIRCDEDAPVCGQCRKTSRECVRGDGVVFRHQHNASMNQFENEEEGALKSFYAYKDTFGPSQVWVDVPQSLTFITTDNPYRNIDESTSQSNMGAPHSVHEDTDDFIVTRTNLEPTELEIVRPHSDGDVDNLPTGLGVMMVTEYEVNFLLKYFADVPGLWMDLFDFRRFFTQHVKMAALQYPFLKYIMCAYAAKLLDRSLATTSPLSISLNNTYMRCHPEGAKIPWAVKAETYLQKAGSLFEEFLEQKKDVSVSVKELVIGHSMAMMTMQCAYGILGASSSEAGKHLNITKEKLFGLKRHSEEIKELSLASSRYAWHASFWYFARQDVIVALTNHTQTRLDPEDSAMWRDVGLRLDDAGFVCVNNVTPWSDGMHDDMMCNALVWLSSKVVNYLVAADYPPAAQHHVWEGISQAALHETWSHLQKQIAVWYTRLSDAFESLTDTGPSTAKNENNGLIFPKIDYESPMAAAAMTHYHMISMLMLLNEPQQSTMTRATFFGRLGSYKAITAQIEQHARAICGTVGAQRCLEAAVHYVEPLYYAGQAFSADRERNEVVRLLRTVEVDTGWPSGFRVQNLFEHWGWDGENS